MLMRRRVYYLLWILLITPYVKLMAQPVADFTVNRRFGCSPLSVQFTSTSTGNPTGYSWAFGNGNTSSLQNPSAIYVVPGTYQVSLTVSNASGTDTKTVSAFIVVFTPPAAGFTVNQTGGCVPLNIQFTDTSSNGSAPISSRLWDFGDGNISTSTSPLHQFILPGSRNVSLTVTDTNGCTSTIVRNNLIQATQSHTIDFTTSNPLVCSAPSTHTFISSVNPAAAGYTYEWTSTIGQTSNTNNFTLNNATTTGQIGVTLKVTATNGCHAIKSLPNAVFVARLQPDFSIQSGSSLLCANTNINFTNTTTPDTPAMLYQWKVNNTLLASTRDYNTSLSPGNYQYTLVASIGACSDSISKSFTVQPKPTAAFTSSLTQICQVPVKVGFQNTSLGNPTQLLWDFGNGQTSSLNQDSALYTNFQPYQVKLKVTNAVGCSDSIIQNLSVIKLQAILSARNSKRGCAPLNTNFNVVNASQFISFRWTLGTLLLDTQASFNYIFTQPGIYAVKLTAFNASGCATEIFDSVYVGANLTSDFTSSKQVGCFNGFSPVQFTNIDTNTNIPVTYNWSWRNGFATGRNTIATFTDTGTYDIQLVLDYYGCLSTIIKPSLITINPARAIQQTAIINCGSDSAVLDASFSSGKNKYQWLLGDGNTSSAVSLIHRYASFGTYLVTLIATDTTTNCVDTALQQIQIAQPLLASYTVTDTLGCSPYPVRLQNTTVLPPSAFPIVQTNWIFSTGETISGNDTTIVLNGAGYKGLRLIITDAKGCVFERNKDSVVRISGGQVRFALTPKTGCTPLQVIASDSSSSDFPIVSRKWYWSFNDTISKSTITIDTFVYNQPQTTQANGYPFVMEITNSIGCKFAGNDLIVPSIPFPLASFTNVPFCGGRNITFHADSSSSLVLKPAQYFWVSGNDTINSQRTFTRSFNQIDTTINIRLIVKDANACMAFKDTSFEVVNIRSRVGFTTAQQKRDCYLPVLPLVLNDTSNIGSGGIKSRLWRVGNTTSTLDSPSYVFTKPGRITVTLILTDSNNCVDSLRVPDYIQLGGPLGEYTIQNKISCSPLLTTFKVNSPNAQFRIWDFGNGLVDTVNVDSFTFNYTDAGNIIPRLTLIDSSGLCSFVFDANDTLTVFKQPETEFTTDKNKICFNTEVSFINQSLNKPAISQWRWLANNTLMSTNEGPVNYVFTSSGKYDISLIAIDSNGCSDTTIRTELITVYNDTQAPLVPSAVRATVLNNSEALFEYRQNSEEDFLKYKVYYNYFSGTPANFTEYFNTDDTLFIQQNINTLTSPYSYQVSAIDLCNNESNKSTIQTTVDIAARPLTNAVGLKWTPYSGFTIGRYEVWRNNPDSGNAYHMIVSTRGNILDYIDTTAKCFTTYYYKIKTISASNDSLYSWSDSSGASPIFLTNLPSTQMFRATVVNNSVLVQWMKRSAELNFKYLIARKRDDDSAFKDYIEVNDTFFIDTDVDVNKHSYSYQIYLKDECGGMSIASNIAKSILLTIEPEITLTGKYNPLLLFTPYQQWLGGVDEYSIEMLDEEVNVWNQIEQTAASDTFYFHSTVDSIFAKYCYRVVAREAGGNQAVSVSNESCISTKPVLFAPSAITINGDNLNEIFEVKGIFIEEFYLAIYDRWGRLVFETTDYKNQWKGEIAGKPAPSDVYTYLAKAKGRYGQEVSISGNVTLLR